MTDHPNISVAEELDTGEFILLATSYGMTEVAGPRLFKAPPHPDIKFRHTDERAANHDADLLQQYIREYWPKKAESKAAIKKNRESRA